MENNKQYFLRELLNQAPDDSYWSIEGLYDARSKQTLSAFFVDAHACAGEGDYCISLTKENKKDLLSLLTDNDITHDMVHCSLFKDGQRLMDSYDFFMTNVFYVDFVDDGFKQYCLENEFTEFK
ncbi:MAG: hypothetical protein JNM41_16300 [Flavipsychrobacter sp.]|nr:hypothetical protein [Flavipsychrobacter sp.]